MDSVAHFGLMFLVSMAHLSQRPKNITEYNLKWIFSYGKKKVQICYINFSLHFLWLLWFKLTFKRFEIFMNTFFVGVSSLSSISNNLYEYNFPFSSIWASVSWSNHLKMHRNVNIPEFYFFILITKNQFKVVFRVNFWVKYQIGNNYKEDKYKISI